MLSHRVTASERKRGTVAVLAILLALRVFWVPAHLVLHEHDLGAGPVHGLAHTEDDASTQQRHDDHDHPPHPAGDHLTQLIASRPSPDLACLWLPASVACLLDPRVQEHKFVQQQADEPPRPPPPRAGRARSPPLS